MASPGDSRLRPLPTEILIEIVKLLPSISSLWSLINAIPQFNSVFLSLPFELLEHFLQKESPPCIQALMRVALVTRISPSWFPGIDDVTKHMSRHKSFDVYFGALSDKVNEPQLALKVALAVRDLVETAHKIHAVAHACLNYYVENSLKIRPERWDESLPPFDHSQIGNQPEGQPIHPEPAGPPTYIEKQTLIRLLWRLEVFSNLRIADKQNQLGHWSHEDRCNINFWNVDYIFHFFTNISKREGYFPTFSDTWNPYCEKEQFKSLMDFVVDITAAKTDLQPGLRELEAFMGNLPADVNAGGYHAACLQSKPIFVTSTGPITIDKRLTATISLDEMIEKPPAGWRLFMEMITDRRYYYSGVPFEPYRKYGFAFWQAERMANLGFKDREGWPDDDDDDHESDLRERYFVWQSILRGVDVINRYGYRHVVSQ